MERTLLLDMSFQPMMTIPWQKAITLLTLGKVEVLHEYDQEVHSTSVIFKLPAVVRLVNMFRRPKRRVKYSKQNIFARDRWTCQYCGVEKETSELTIDHVVPKSQGGKTEWGNVVSACKACNAKKADRTPQESSMRLRHVPTKPDWIPLLTLKIGNPAPGMWKNYLG
jgi:5-methylcytosine-specific restriction endonuclease McrA